MTRAKFILLQTKVVRMPNQLQNKVIKAILQTLVLIINLVLSDNFLKKINRKITASKLSFLLWDGRLAFNSVPLRKATDALCIQTVKAVRAGAEYYAHSWRG
jgi:hypothetical protein